LEESKLDGGKDDGSMAVEKEGREDSKKLERRNYDSGEKGKSRAVDAEGRTGLVRFLSFFFSPCLFPVLTTPMLTMLTNSMSQNSVPAPTNRRELLLPLRFPPPALLSRPQASNLSAAPPSPSSSSLNPSSGHSTLKRQTVVREAGAMKGAGNLGKVSGNQGGKDGRALLATVRGSDGGIGAGKKAIELEGISVRLPFLPFLSS
jgi:hypothetical protein